MSFLCIDLRNHIFDILPDSCCPGELVCRQTVRNFNLFCQRYIVVSGEYHGRAHILTALYYVLEHLRKSGILFSGCF